jgi:hypothetical protein
VYLKVSPIRGLRRFKVKGGSHLVTSVCSGSWNGKARELTS